MEFKENTFTFDNYSIYNRIINHKLKTDTGLLLIHGKGSHSGIISNIAVRDDIAYFTFDLPGFGKSSGRRGHIPTFDIYYSLVRYYIEHTVKPHGIKNLVIIGESMGALIALHTSLNYKDPIIKGLIFLPGVYEVPILKKKSIRCLLSILNKIAPLFIIQGMRPISTYTDHTIYQKEIANDPLWERKKTIRLISEIHRSIQYLNNEINNISVPALIFQAGNEVYSSSKKAREVFELLPFSPLNQFVLLKNSKHWLIIGNEVETINKTIGDWVDSVVCR